MMVPSTLVAVCAVSGGQVGMWDPRQGSAVRWLHPQLGEVMGHSGGSLADAVNPCAAGMGSSQRAEGHGRMGLGAPGEMTPCAQGGGVLAAMLMGVLHLQCTKQVL